MKGFLFLFILVFASPLMAHYQCDGICKFYDRGSLSSRTVSGSGDSNSSASSSMKNSCSDYCSSYGYTGCTVINYSCSTPTHGAMPTESFEVFGVETEN
jgi:hypothetical protein